MNVLTAMFFALSVAGILYIQAIVLNIISGEQTIRSRLLVSIIIVGVYEFIAEFYYDFFPSGTKFVLAIISEFISCFLMWFSRKNYKISDALITIIVQEFCSLVYSVIYTVLPEQLIELQTTYAAGRLIVVAAIMTMTTILYKKVKLKKIDLSNFFEIIPKRVYVFMYLSMFIESGVITILSYDMSYSAWQMNFTKVFLFILTAINATIIVTLIINVVYQKYYSNLNRMLKELVNSQLQHYEKRETLNAEIRSFRHDFNNHIRCLESMMASEKYDDVKKYLQNISGMMPPGEFLFRTGNYIADALLTEIQETNKNVTVEFNGVIPPNIDNADLCVVLSNAMDNAVEACAAVPGNNVISVYGNCQQGVFVLIIKNPTVQTGYAEDAMHKTSKSDKELHGFGLSNIKRTVRKYDGTMHTLLENGCFTLSLTLTLETVPCRT